MVIASQTAVLAGSMTYEVDGEQYVATLVGWGGSYAILGGGLATISGPQRNISRLLVYKRAAPRRYRLAGRRSTGPRSAKQTGHPAIIAVGKRLTDAIASCVMVSML